MVRDGALCRACQPRNACSTRSDSAIGFALLADMSLLLDKLLTRLPVLREHPGQTVTKHYKKKFYQKKFFAKLYQKNFFGKNLIKKNFFAKFYFSVGNLFTPRYGARVIQYGEAGLLLIGGTAGGTNSVLPFEKIDEHTFESKISKNTLVSYVDWPETFVVPANFCAWK